MNLSKIFFGAPDTGGTTASGAGSAAGAAVATAVGAVVIAAVALSAGIGAASGLSGVRASAAGAGAATGVGRSTAASVGAAAGAGVPTGVGRSTKAATGAAAGAGVASGVGSTVSVTVAINDSNWFFSPGNWYKSGSTYAQSNNPGAYFKVKFSGTSVKLNVDVSPLTAASVSALNYPAIKYSIDGGAFTRYQLTSSDTQLSLGSGLSSGQHTLVVYFVGIQWDSNDRWLTPTMVLRVTGLVLQGGQSLSAPTLEPFRMIVYGDSNLEGQEALHANTTVANQDAQASFGLTLGFALHCEVGIVGFSGQGFEGGNQGNLVSLVDAWDFYADGKSRLSAGAFVDTFDYIVCNHGINGGGSAATVSGLIAAWRAAAASARILMAVPWTAADAANIATGVTNAADANTKLLNTGRTNYATQPSGGHLSTAGHADYAADLLALLNNGVGSAVGSGVATGIGRATKSAIGASSGAGVATGVGRSTKAAVATSAGGAGGLGVSQPGAALGDASGVGAAQGVGATIRAAVGASAGSGNGAAVGRGIAAGQGLSAGVGAASGAGEGLASAAAHAAGQGDGAASGASRSAAVGSAAGAGAADGRSTNYLTPVLRQVGVYQTTIKVVGVYPS